VVLSLTGALAQAPKEKEAAAPSKPPWQRVLQGDDAKRVELLEKQVADLEKKGRFAQAIVPVREVLAIRSRAQGEDHWETINARIKEQTYVRVAGLPREVQSDLAAALRQKGEAEEHSESGRYAQAEPLFHKIWETHRRVLGEDHPDTARCYNDLASSIEGRGDYAEAERLYQKALAICRRALGEDHPDTARCYNDLASSIDSQGKFAEAERLYQQALTICRRALGEDHPHTVYCYNNLAYSLNGQGKYAEAESLLRRALGIRRRTLGEDHPDTALSYNNLAVNLGDQGKYAEAEPLLQKALAIRRGALGEDHPDTAESYNNLAVNLHAQRRYAEEEQGLRKALAICRLALGEDDRYTATAYRNLAANLDAQGKYVEAQSLCRKALATFQSRLGQNHPATAYTYGLLAANLDAQGKNTEAEPLYRTALAMCRSTLGEDHPNTAATYNNLASHLEHRGKTAEAEVVAIAAARSYEKARLRVSFRGLERADFASHRSPLPLVATILARRGNDQDAWWNWEAGMARGLLDDLTARHSRFLTPDERRRQDDLIGQLDRLDNEISAMAGAKNLQGGQLKRLDDLKGQRLELQGRIAEIEATLIQKYKAPAGAIYALDQIQARIPADAALVGWLDLETLPDAADPRGDHWACVVRRSGAPRWIRIVGTGPNQAWTKDDDRRPSQVGELLSADIAKPWQNSLAGMAAQRLSPLEAALAARGGLPAVRHLIVLPSPAMAGIPIEALLEARPPAAPRYLISYAPSGTLFAWLQERRRESKTIGERPRRLLALGDPVPPPADEPAPKPPDQGLLVQRVEPGSHAEQAGIRPGDVLLQYAGAKLATLDDLQKQVQAGAPTARTVGVAVWRDGKMLHLTLRPGPLGVVPNSQPAAVAILAKHEGDALLRRSRGAAFDRLPGSRREVQAIADIFDWREVYVGSDASEQTLESLRARDGLGAFTVIHLATHGKIDDRSPMNSRLLLSQDKLPDPTAAYSPDSPAYDGTLSAGEVMGLWRLDAELVTLSACRSGLGRESGGEGFVGFAQAFFLAGARSVIVSLWEVDDRATSLLMTRFYQNWLGKRPGLERHLSKAQALGEAKAWLRALTQADVERELSGITRGEIRRRSSPLTASHPFDHPHDWAGFILLGDPN
jgi:tetratricopeptide (TPR) repeat protein